MTEPFADFMELSRNERADIVLRADLRGELAPILEGGKERKAPADVAKSVLFVLDQFPPDSCYPSEDLIARCACANIRTVRRAIKALINSGLLETYARHAKASRYKSQRRYVIQYDILANLDPRAQHIEDPKPALSPRDTPGRPWPHGRVSPVPMGAQPCPHGPAKQTTEPQKVNPDNSVSKATRVDQIREDLKAGAWMERVRPALVRAGVGRQHINKLLREAGSEERILEVLRLMESQLSAGSLIRNPGGWITQAIRQGWTTDRSRSA